MTGVLPSKNSLRLSLPNGDHGTVQAATPSAAGCMTADHVQRLEALWQAHQTQTGAIVIERPAASVDVSQMVTREQLKGILGAIPRTIDARAVVQPLAAEIADIRAQMLALPAPTPDAGPVSGVVAQVIEQVSIMDERLRAVEQVIDAIRQVAAIKAAVEVAT